MKAILKNAFKIIPFRKSESGVTEVVDFITIIGVLIISLSIIGLIGYPILNNAQEARYIENTRKSFIVMAENINKVAQGETPSQSIELKMYGGRLSVAGDSTMKIDVTWFNASKPGNEVTTLYNEQMRGIENTIGDVVVAYEGTGVWIKYPNGVILNAYKPLFAGNGGVITIPVVTIAGISASSGSGDIKRLKVAQSQQQKIYSRSNVSKITMTINSSYSKGWQQYYTDALSWDACSANCTVQLNTSNTDLNLLRTIMYAEVE